MKNEIIHTHKGKQCTWAGGQSVIVCTHRLADCYSSFSLSLHCLCNVFSPFFSVAHAAHLPFSMPSYGLLFVYSFFTLPLARRFELFTHGSLPFRLVRGVSWNVVVASVRTANFINHLNIALVARKMLMQMFIGVY